MWQIRFCPGCGARVTCGDRFCGRCGANLACVVQQVRAQWHDYQYTYQRLQQHNPPCNRPAAPADANQSQQPCPPVDDSHATPITIEISKLLSDLFQKRLEHSE